MNQIIKAWAEKNGFKPPTKGIDGNIYLDKFYYGYRAITLVIYKDKPFIARFYYYDERKNEAYEYARSLQATLQCGLPMLWGI